jgi:hypothetical protein
MEQRSAVAYEFNWQTVVYRDGARQAIIGRCGRRRRRRSCPSLWLQRHSGRQLGLNRYALQRRLKNMIDT